MATHDGSGTSGAGVIVAGVRTPFVQGVRRAHEDRHHRARRRRRRARCSSSTELPRTRDRRHRVGRRDPARPRAERGARDRARSRAAAVVEAMTVTRACASGLQAITLAAAAIERGEADVDDRRRLATRRATPRSSCRRRSCTRSRRSRFGKADAGRLPRRARAARCRSPRSCRSAPKIAERTTGQVMGEAAEEMARRNEISREAQDEFAVRSHQRAAAAIASGPLRRRGRAGADARGRVGAHRQPRARRHQRREAGEAAAGVRQGRHASPPATRARSPTARPRCC